MVQMTFKLNCRQTGRFKNGVYNAISSKIGGQMGAAIKMLLLYLPALQRPDYDKIGTLLF